MLPLFFDNIHCYKMEGKFTFSGDLIITPRIIYYFPHTDLEQERINRGSDAEQGFLGSETLGNLFLGRDPQPSAGAIDSQSVKTTGVGGADRGFDGGKKVSGRKRHLLVDTQGFVLKAKVHSAAVMDRDGVELLPEQGIKDELPGMKQVWLDGGYKGEGKGKQWIEQHMGWSAEMVQHPPKPRGVWARGGEEVDWSKIMPPPGFRVLPRRWVVERTFSWLSQSRRLSKGYERLMRTGESMIYAAMRRLMVRRLAKT